MARDEHWYVLELQPGFGPTVEIRLQKNGVPVLLLEDRTSDSSSASDRNSEVYVFAHLTAHHRAQILTLPGFVCIAGVPKPTPVQNDYISILQAAAEAKLELIVAPSIPALQSGKILAGPLGNRSAKLLKRHGIWHLGVPIAPLDRTFLFALPDTPVELNSIRRSR